MYNIAKLSNNDRDIVFTKYAFVNYSIKMLVIIAMIKQRLFSG